MNSLNWERLRIFKAVLESQSLSAAARQLGLSQPTVSRQIRALEKELGESLVNTTPEGIVVTREGLRLAPLLGEMMQLADQIGHDPTAPETTPVVRIACGAWVAGLIARHCTQITGSPAACQLEIASSVLFADIPRREADIAVRTKRPETGRMKIRRLAHFPYAVYGAKTLVENHPGAFDERRFTDFEWAMLLSELDHFPTSKWLRTRCSKTPLIKCSSSTTLIDAVKSAEVLAILPVFVGGHEPQFQQVSEPFVPDRGQIWMVLPEDVNQRPPIRRVADQLITLFDTHGI